MVVRNKIKNQRGFTLVELMTVVAIIGVLASVGVPQYRKIQRKARRAEATLALGVIASAEAGFYAEYSGYGANMGGIGAELESAPKNYNVGFLSATGVPTTDNLKFCELNKDCAAANPATFPGYSTAQIVSPTVDAAGVLNLQNKASITGFWAILTTPGNVLKLMDNTIMGGTSGNEPGIAGFSFASHADADGDNNKPYMYCDTSTKGCTFRAIATGNLYGRKGSDVKMDVISINQQRVIKQVQDGT
ncbi:MAG: prepilin-type N-terminal cleavage/methylation domain-containing protein [Proteobacteria bacterium]|nr:prepilin-type N-terminal cleavage/methylation domain-containing protein [Pseudomonadota bacterium]